MPIAAAAATPAIATHDIQRGVVEAGTKPCERSIDRVAASSENTACSIRLRRGGPAGAPTRLPAGAAGAPRRPAHPPLPPPPPPPARGRPPPSAPGPARRGADTAD